MPAVTTPSTDVVAADEAANIPTKKVELLGETFLVMRTFNVFNLGLVLDDNPASQMASIAQYLINAVAPEDRVRLKNHLARQASLDADDIVGIFNTVQEAQAAPVPTRRPAASRRTTAKKGASRPSVVRSSARG